MQLRGPIRGIESDGMDLHVRQTLHVPFEDGSLPTARLDGVDGGSRVVMRQKTVVAPQLAPTSTITSTGETKGRCG